MHITILGSPTSSGLAFFRTGLSPVRSIGETVFGENKRFGIRAFVIDSLSGAERDLKSYHII